jgi:hypothetical protein
VRKVSETVKDKGKKALENVSKEKLMQHSKVGPRSSRFYSPQLQKLVAAVDEALGMPKVVRLVDQMYVLRSLLLFLLLSISRSSFTLGVAGMLATEYFMLEHPQVLYIVWSVILPLVCRW